MNRIILTFTLCVFTLSSFSQTKIINGDNTLLSRINENFTSANTYEIYTMTNLDSIVKFTIFDHDLNIVEEFSSIQPEVKYHSSYSETTMRAHGNFNIYDFDNNIGSTVTKDFWGNNNEYEYCVPTTCTDSVLIGSYIYTQYVNGFKIMGHKGSTFFQLTIPRGYYCTYSIFPFFYIIDDKIKCLVYAYDTNYNNQYTLIYDITKQISVESTLVDCQLVSIKPTLLNQSEPVNIEFSSTSNNEKLIEVYSASGQIAYSTKTSGECSNISIPSIYFPKGINIVKISENGKQIYTTKIIVR